MEKLAEMALLADFYGPLLTERQRGIWDLYYQQDLSLAEIAELEQISRQGIHDLLKRTERNLAEYEKKLGLVRRFWAEREKLTEGKTLAHGFEERDFANGEAWERHRQLRDVINEAYDYITC